jgi:hypothetical protein
MPEVRYRDDNRTVARIKAREAPGVLSRSSDPTKRMAEDHFFDGEPLRHRSAIYDGGMQGTFKADVPPIQWR